MSFEIFFAAALIAFVLLVSSLIALTVFSSASSAMSRAAKKDEPEDENFDPENPEHWL